MKVFITGAAGFVGQELQAQCEQNGIDVVAVDLSKRKDDSRHIFCDIRSKNVADFIPEQVDAVIHLAGLTRNTDCKDNAYACFDANVMATLNLMEACQRRKVKQFIFASSEWVYDNFRENEVITEETKIDMTQLDSEYAFSKLVSEQNLRQKYRHGFCAVTILRFGIIYGNRKQGWSAVESIFDAVLKQDEIKIGSLKTGRCFVHISDIIRGIIQSLGLDGFHIINLQGDQFMTLGDIINISKKVLHKNLKVIETDPDNITARHVSNQKAKKILGWTPHVNLEQGLIQFHDFLMTACVAEKNKQ